MSAESGWVRIADSSECPPGRSLECVAAGRIVALFNVDGQWFALDGICPHQGGPLGQGKVSDGIVTCPWHGFQFDVLTGRHAGGLTLQQETFPVKQENGGIFVRLPPAE